MHQKLIRKTNRYCKEKGCLNLGNLNNKIIILDVRRDRMGKEAIIETVKIELTTYLSELSEDNIEEITLGMKSQIEILEVVRKADFITEKESQNEERIADEIKQTKKREELQEYKSKDGKVFYGYFKQRTRGGILSEKFQIFVPEIVVRNLNLETGDFISGEQIGIDNKKQQYKFSVVKKTDKKHQKIREKISMVPVQFNKEVKRFFVERENDLEALEMSVPVLLKDSDVQKYNIKEGNLIDYAYPYNGAVNDGYVIWKYDNLSGNKDISQ